MSRLNYSYRDLETVKSKLKPALISTKRGKEQRYYVEYEGQQLFMVTFPNQHGSGQTPSKGFLQQLIKDLRLNKDKDLFDGLIKCPKKFEDYEPFLAQQSS